MTLARPFAVGVYVVTFEVWDACVSDGRCGGYRLGDRGWGRGRRPVPVGWDDAQAYVAWPSGKTGAEYRLLSESEWEYVARAGTGTARYWGEGEEGQCRYANGFDLTAKRHHPGSLAPDCEDGHYRTAPVGSYEANGFGLHDVLGNVLELVQDCGKRSSWSYVGAPSDGSAWESGECGLWVLRGGSWISGPGHLRSAHRAQGAANWRRDGFGGYGLRVARNLK